MRICSCYFFPKHKINKFEDNIDQLEINLKSAKGGILIAGDFNSKCPELSETRSEKRGSIICDFVARKDLVILNRGDKHTFQRGDAFSILGITIGSTKLVRNVKN